MVGRVNDRGESQTPTLFLNKEGKVVFASRIQPGKAADLVVSGRTESENTGP